MTGKLSRSETFRLFATYYPTTILPRAAINNSGICSVQLYVSHALSVRQVDVLHEQLSEGVLGALDSHPGHKEGTIGLAHHLS